ncbi:MAG: hypothetical protein ACT4P4_04745 [Betaproteobacteria bacterium]
MTTSKKNLGSRLRGNDIRALFPVFFLSAAVALAQPQERTLTLDNGESLRFEVLDAAVPDYHSARSVSERLLRHLAAGELEDAALLSTAPRRRYRELADYLLTVGEREFRDVFQRYLAAGAPLVEIAIDRHRLLVWDLAEGGERRMAGQYFVQIDGRFLLDDVPNETRARLRRVLEAYRAGKLRLSARTG